MNDEKALPRRILSTMQIKLNQDQILDEDLDEQIINEESFIG